MNENVSLADAIAQSASANGKQVDVQYDAVDEMLCDCYRALRLGADLYHGPQGSLMSGADDNDRPWNVYLIFPEYENPHLKKARRQSSPARPIRRTRRTGQRA